jgi:hypothetical protein
VLAPGPELARLAHAVAGSDGAALGTLADAEVLGVIAAGRRLAAWAVWTETVALAEFGRRRAAPAEPSGVDRGAADEVAWKTRMTWTSAADRMARACATADRLPCTLQALRDGRIDPGYVTVIADWTSVLSPGDCTEADRLLAEAAAHKTYGELKAAAARLVMRLDPDAVRRRKEQAAKRDTQVRVFREDSGNAGLSARELPPADALASWQNIEQRALDLRAAGIDGSLRELRVLATLDLLLERDSRDTLTPPDQDASSGPAGSEDQNPHDAGPPGSEAGLDGSQAGPPRSQAGPGNPEPDDFEPDGPEPGDWGPDGPEPGHPEPDGSQPDGPEPDGPDGPYGDGPGRPGEPRTNGPGARGPAGGGAATGDRTSHSRRDGNGRGGGTGLAAQPVIVIPWEALSGGPSGPGEIPGFGMIDPETAQDLLAAACRSQQTRVCVTVLGPDGTARLHGCAPGRPDLGRYTANRTAGARAGPPGSGPRAGKPDPGSAPPSACGPEWGAGSASGAGPSLKPGPGSVPEADRITAAELIKRLKVRLVPIARDGCRHEHAEPGYISSRRLRHLVKARSITCAAPGCGRSAAHCDLDHTVAWDKSGITCECNLAPLCRHHHRVKQSNGWQLEQPAPGVLVWRTPAGLEYTTGPTGYRAA